MKWNVTKQNFSWVNNATLDFGTWENWDKSWPEPDCMDISCPSSLYQNCVRIRKLGWVWKTIQCDTRYAVLCERCVSKYNHTYSTISTLLCFHVFSFTIILQLPIKGRIMAI